MSTTTTFEIPAGQAPTASQRQWLLLGDDLHRRSVSLFAGLREVLREEAGDDAEGDATLAALEAEHRAARAEGTDRDRAERLRDELALLGNTIPVTDKAGYELAMACTAAYHQLAKAVGYPEHLGEWG